MISSFSWLYLHFIFCNQCTSFLLFMFRKVSDKFNNLLMFSLKSSLCLLWNLWLWSNSKCPKFHAATLFSFWSFYELWHSLVLTESPSHSIFMWLTLDLVTKQFQKQRYLWKWLQIHHDQIQSKDYYTLYRLEFITRLLLTLIANVWSIDEWTEFYM